MMVAGLHLYGQLSIVMLMLQGKQSICFTVPDFCHENYVSNHRGHSTN
jgi:hypothetical protein